jgi:heat shock protein HspQ
MNFQLLKLIIWPKNKQFAPRIIEFKPGMVNVISGASRTGKSAIIPIIDYCLAASDCFIPIDTIRDYASWYGVVFQTESEQILISRKVPIGNKVSNEFYLSRGLVISIPPIIEQANEKIEGVKHILNAITNVPYFKLGNDDEKEGYQSRLSFRDLMAFVFQNQDIVANQNILFYKTHAHEHRERLRNWFPYVLGAETIEILSARQRLQQVDKRLKHLTREFEKVKMISDSWMNNMLGHIKVAKEYGIIGEEVSDTTPPEELIEIARQILEDIPEHSTTKLNNIESANIEILQLEEEEKRISNSIAVVKKRLNNVKRLKMGFVEYGGAIQKRVERLHISQWLEDIALEAQNCPTCGSAEHPNTQFELSKISHAFKQYEQQAKSVSEVPNSFSREEERIKQELDELIEEKERLQKRFDLLIARNQEAQEEFQLRKSMFLFLGHLQATMETFEKLIDGGDYQIEIESLYKEYERLIKIVDPNSVKKRIEAATLAISQGILKHLQNLDVEDKYRQIPPRFSVKDLHISVLSNDNNWHFLAEVGSASNWVSFHIALMCSLQEYFLKLEGSCVPSFVIFDQPSQVYFPKLKRNSKKNEDDPKFEDEDVVAVKQIFATLAKSIVSEKGRWQSIVLDHADSNIYGDINGIHEVDVWRNGKKLIPVDWYE